MAMASTIEGNQSLKENLAFVPSVAQPIAEEASDMTTNMTYHAQYSPHFMPLKFDLEQECHATAESVQYFLIQVHPLTLIHKLFYLFIMDHKRFALFYL